MKPTPTLENNLHDSVLFAHDRCVMSLAEFYVFDYFNAHGERVERYYCTRQEGDDSKEAVRQAVKAADHHSVLDRMKRDALASGAASDLGLAAMALNCLTYEVEDRHLPIETARKVASIGVDFRKAVTIGEIMPVFETKFRFASISWARGIFSHLNLGSPFPH